MDNKIRGERAFHIVPEIKKVSDAFREQRLPVIYCNDSHIKGIDKEISLWGEPSIRGTDGAKAMNSRDLLGEL